jgi:hypothetical protein
MSQKNGFLENLMSFISIFEKFRHLVGPVDLRLSLTGHTP